MATRVTKRKTPAKREKSTAQLAVSEAGRVTGRIVAYMKNISRAYLQIGELLTRVRDQKLYERLRLKKHDLETYALTKLKMKRSSLYTYIAAYEWARKNHPEWLEPNYKGPLPDLHDVTDMSYIDTELTRDNLTKNKRSKLKALRAKGEAGTLRKSEVDAIRRQTHGSKEALQNIIASLQVVRRKSGKLNSMPADALAHIDAAIQILQKQEGLRLAGLSFNSAIDIEHINLGTPVLV